MKPDTNDRVTREAEFYDNARLQRDGFENTLAYLNNGIGKLRRNDLILTEPRLAQVLRPLR